MRVYIANRDGGNDVYDFDPVTREVRVGSNQIVIIDVGANEMQDQYRSRNPYWLYQGSNAVLHTPFFCYGGYTIYRAGPSFRMSMLATYWNYSGIYEFHAGQLRTFLNLIVAGKRPWPSTMPRICHPPSYDITLIMQVHSCSMFWVYTALESLLGQVIQPERSSQKFRVVNSSSQCQEEMLKYLPCARTNVILFCWRQ